MGKSAPKLQPLAPQEGVNQIGDQQQARIDTSSQRQVGYNRPDQINQFGNSLKWIQNGTDENGNPTFTQVQSLGDQGQQFAGGFAGLGQKYFDLANNPGEIGSMDAYNKANEFWDKTEGARQEAARKAFENKLANQGFSTTDEGYKSAMQDFSDQQARDRAAFQQSAQGQFFNQGLQALGARANLLQPGIAYGSNVLGSGFQGFNPVSSAPVDLTALYGLQNNRDVANLQAQTQANSDMMSGLVKGGLGIAGLAMAPFTGGLSLGLAGLGGAANAGIGSR